MWLALLLAGSPGLRIRSGTDCPSAAEVRAQIAPLLPAGMSVVDTGDAPARRIMTALTPRHDEVLAATGPDPLQELELRSAVEAAYRVIDRLPEKYRRVLVLSELDEMPPDAIAALLDARVETVHVWLHRARRMFLAKLRESDHPGDDDNRQEPK